MSGRPQRSRGATTRAVAASTDTPEKGDARSIKEGNKQATKRSSSKEALSQSVQSQKKKQDGRDATEPIFSGCTFYLLPLELPQVRREIFSARVGERGGKMAALVLESPHQMVSHIIVDDHISLTLLCKALLRAVSDALHHKETRVNLTNWIPNPEAKQCLLEAIENSSTVILRAAWLTACLREKALLDPKSDAQSDSLLNLFVQTFLIGNLEEIGKEGSFDARSQVGKKKPVTRRDNSLSREISYHSDDDHKSRASSISDLSVVGDDGEDSSHAGHAYDDDDITPTQPSPHRSQSGSVWKDSEDTPASKLKKSNFFLSPASGKVLAPENQKLVEQLEEMMKMYRNIGDKFRGYAYARAISAIRKYPKPIVNAQQLKDLKNVGPRIASHIMEFLDTGRLGRNEEMVHKDDVNVAINLFVNIHGVGTKTAQRWTQMGYRTLDDIREKATLTTEQKIGLNYYDEFQEKMPRKEVEEIFKIVEQTTNDLQKGFIFEVCGSYRRGRDFCGDVDILMTHPDGHSHATIMKPLVDRLHQTGFLTDDLTFAEGHHKKYFGVCRLNRKGAKHRRLDIIIPPYSEWATCVLGWSGSMYFVRSIRDYAHKKNMSLTDYSLNKNVIRQDGEKVNEGERIDTPTEESIFEVLGLPYLAPEERDH